MENNSRNCSVGSQTVQMLKLGHPWVIKDRFTQQWPAGKCGDLISLVAENGEFLGCALRDDEGPIVARVVAARPVSLSSGWFEEKLLAARSVRDDHVDLDETTAYRLVNAEGDGLPGITVERYADHLMVQFYTRSWEPYRNALVAALNRVFAPAGIYEKFRPQQTQVLEKHGSKRYSRLLSGQPAATPCHVRENGLIFKVDLGQGLNTGLFMDQRANRRDLMGRVAGKKVLNLFAYTGAFSVAAAAAGAQKVTSVDASAPYLEWAQENFGLNRLNPKRHEFIVGDCFDVLPRLLQQGARYDVVLMDPPSFSTTSRNRFTTSGGTAKLIALALALLVPGGLLVSSSNHQKVDVADYLKELRRAALEAGCGLRVLKMAGQGQDFLYPVTFPEGRYLKYVIAVKGEL